MDPTQPSWFLYGALRALALFTSSEFSVHSSLAYVFDGYSFVGFFLIITHAFVVHSGKELYKRFLSIPGTSPGPSQGGDLESEIDPDVEIVQEDVKLPHLECLCLHLGDHTRDSEDVSPVSNFLLPLSHFLCTSI